MKTVVMLCYLTIISSYVYVKRGESLTKLYYATIDPLKLFLFESYRVLHLIKICTGYILFEITLAGLLFREIS